MFCPSCGKKISETSVFCKYCGNKIDDSSEKEIVLKNKSTSYNESHKSNIKFKKIAYTSRTVWFLSLILFGVLAAVLTYKLDPEFTSLFSKISLISIFVIGVGSFILMCLTFSIYYSFSLHQEKNTFFKIIRFFLNLLLLPFVIMRNLWDSLFGFFILLPMWAVGFFGFLYLFGFYTSGRPVIGTSMFPTIHDQESVDMYAFSFVNKFINKPKKGDIIIFSSGRTSDDKGQINDYIKRVVATEGDKVQIRDGFLYLNNQITNEPYTAKARSTFGGLFLKECQENTVPSGFVFVMGDNRKRSKDSRDIGFVSVNEINSILPLNKQSIFTDRQRDVSHDKDHQGLPSFDFEDYYLRINKIRSDNGLKPLKRNEKLEKDALLRAKSIIDNKEVENMENIDNGKYPFEKAIKDSGYSNILTGEIRTTGYYDSEELSNYWLDYETKESILDKQYQDTGIAAYVGKINDCEVQVIVEEFGGFVPPSYSKSTIESWREAVNHLSSIIPSWENARGWGTMNQEDLNKLLNLLSKEKIIASNILSKMEANKWLTSQEDQSIKEYNSLVNQSSALADKLNN